MKAVIMAGGEGTRLRPLTSNQPKPMVPVINKPVMEHIVELLKKHGITDIVATLQFLAPLVKNYFGDGTDLDVHMSYSMEETPLGTAGSVKKVAGYLNETFVVISGDALTDVDLSEAIDFHRSKGALATLVLKSVENPLQFGVVVTDKEGRIERFLEKPTWGQVFSDTVNTGIYILEPEVLKYIPEDAPFDFSRDLFPKLLKAKKPLYGYVTEGYWWDIGSLDQYIRVHQDILKNKTKIELEGFKVGRTIWIGEGAVIDPMADLRGPIVIGKHSKIEAGARIRPYTVIGNNTVVKSGAFVHRAVIWDNSYIGPNAQLRGCVVGRNCDIKSGARLEEGVAVGDNCNIGENALISHNVRIYPFKTVEPSAPVTASIIWESRGVRALFGRHGVSGLINIDITPRLAMRIAVAYGTALPQGSTVAISSDAVQAARIMKQAIIAGLNSTGVNCRDLEHRPTPVNRLMIINEYLAGGIDVRLSPFDPQSIEINFLDSNGLDIAEDVQSDIEKYFYRGDFRRAFFNEIGEVSFSPRTLDIYTNALLENLDVEIIRKAKFKLVVDYGFGRAAQVAPAIFGRLGLGVIALNATLGAGRQPLDRQEFERSLRQISTSVRALKADLGVFIDSASERIYLIDEKGQRISQPTALILLIKLMCEAGKGGRIVVPLSISKIAEEIATANQCEVQRVPIRASALMEASQKDTVIFAGAEGGGYIFPEFLPAYDALMSLGKILEILAKTKKSLSSLVNTLPRYYVVHKQEICPWEKKGFVMRQLMEEAKGRKVELIDGVKIYLRNGWVLLLPDPDEPLCHIYAEGVSQKQADERSQKYVRFVRRMCA